MSDPAQVRSELERFRASSKLFASLDAAGLERLAKVAKPVAFKPNDTIVNKGEAADTFYVIVQGGARVVTDGREEDKEVARLGPGNFFGEMGILNDEPRTATVRAIGDVHCLVFEKEALLGILHDYPQVMHALGSIGVERAG